MMRFGKADRFIDLTNSDSRSSTGNTDSILDRPTQESSDEENERPEMPFAEMVDVTTSVDVNLIPNKTLKDAKMRRAVGDPRRVSALFKISATVKKNSKTKLDYIN